MTASVALDAGYFEVSSHFQHKRSRAEAGLCSLTDSYFRHSGVEKPLSHSEVDRPLVKWVLSSGERYKSEACI